MITGPSKQALQGQGSLKNPYVIPDNDEDSEEDNAKDSRKNNDEDDEDDKKKDDGKGKKKDNEEDEKEDDKKREEGESSRQQSSPLFESQPPQRQPPRPQPPRIRPPQRQHRTFTIECENYSGHTQQINEDQLAQLRRGEGNFTCPACGCDMGEYHWPRPYKGDYE